MIQFKLRFYHLVLDKILLWLAFVVCLIVQFVSYIYLPDSDGFHEFLKINNSLFAGGILSLIRHDMREVREAWKISNGEKDANK